MKKLLVILAVLAIAFVFPVVGNAESLGAYCWKAEPLSGIVCFDVDDLGYHVYAIHGIWCAPPVQLPIGGTANYDEYQGVTRLIWNVGRGTDFRQFAAEIDPITKHGTWTCDDGSSGDFSYLGLWPL